MRVEFRVVSSLPSGARCATHPYVAAAYLCARCGTFLCTECAVVAEDAESYCTACEASLPGAIPWERRRRIGRLRAVGGTALAVVLAPAAFFRHEPRERSIWPTVMFGYLFTLVVDVMDLGRALVIWQTDPGYRDAFVAGFRQSAGTLPAVQEHAEVAWWLSEFGAPLGSPLWYGGWLVVTSSAWWVGLRIVGGPVPFREIVRGLSYTNVIAGFGLLTMWIAGPAVLFTSIVFALWSAILQIFAMSRLVRHELGRAVGAFLVMLLLLVSGGCVACLVPSAMLSALS